MLEIMHFLLHHWLLSSLLVILLICLFINEIRDRQFIKNQLSAQEVVQMMNHHHAILIDIRDHQSFEKAHILGALCYPQSELEKKISLVNKYKSQSVILICAMGNSSLKMMSQLKAEGFEQVYYLSGGMMAWEKENLPVLKGSI